MNLIPTGYERLLPPGVQLVVRSRRRALAGRARGDVLDLGGAGAHNSLWTPDDPGPVDEIVRVDGTSDPALMALARSGRRFDTVFSIFQLSAANDLSATLHRISRLLAPDGQILFLEPARAVGLPGHAQRIIAPVVGLATGWHVARDIPVSLRDAGLSVISIDRHRVTTIQWWLSRLVEGVAHHAVRAGDPPVDTEV